MGNISPSAKLTIHCLSKQGVIPIENEKRVDWNAIRAEYIAGGISQRKIAKKYGIPEGTVLDRANKEGWKASRNQVAIKSITATEQKTAEAAADNATLAQDIKRSLLLRLQRIEAKYPFDATEIRTHEGKNTVTFKLRDLTAAYKDLADGLTLTDEESSGLLRSLMELERRAGL